MRAREREKYHELIVNLSRYVVKTILCQYNDLKFIINSLFSLHVGKLILDKFVSAVLKGILIIVPGNFFFGENLKFRLINGAN